jgi:hypothetical protein
MGQDVENREITAKDRQVYRAKVHQCLDVFAEMLRESKFDFEDPLTGLEIEFNLIDGRNEPAMKNGDVLAAIASEDFQTELAQFNIEINVKPRSLAGSQSVDLEGELREILNEAERRASTAGAGIVMIGILPTLTQQQLTLESLSPNPRYKLINQQMLAARGEDMHIHIDGRDRLSTYADTIAPEAACTSVQFHLQVSPQEYASAWNAAQCLAGIQVALGANSPYLFGKQLWRETRIALFEQATDTRPEELKAQGVRPRVWFGERWITSVFDQFEENVRYFPALLPIVEDEDPAATLAAGGTPRLGELRMHNGTIYRWNRPVYDVADGRPHLRVENRVLPAGPTVADILANSAFYYGALKVLAAAERPLWSQMSFPAAEDNFYSGARHGIEARMYWPGVGEIPVAELVLRHLLPMAAQGLDEWGVDPAARDRWLSIIEGRCLSGINGAEWQVRTLEQISAKRSSLHRHDALREMLGRYVANMHSNEPVHTWAVD